MYDIIKCNKIIKKLCDSICMVLLGVICLSLDFLKCFVKMNENQWKYDNIMFEEVNMNEENEEKSFPTR